MMLRVGSRSRSESTLTSGKDESSKKKRVLFAFCPLVSVDRNYLVKLTQQPSRVESKRTLKPAAIIASHSCKMSVLLLKSEREDEGVDQPRLPVQWQSRLPLRSHSRRLIVSMQPCCSSAVGRRTVSGRC